MPYDAREIANLYLDVSAAAHWPVTNLHLQKALYFCHGYSLCLHNAPLIDSPFEAWQHGPVVSIVYDAFKVHKNLAITSRAKIFNLDSMRDEIAMPPSDDRVKMLVKTIFERYGKLSGEELSKMSHEENGAWRITLKSVEKQPSAGLFIENTLIKSHVSEHINLLWQH